MTDREVLEAMFARAGVVTGMSRGPNTWRVEPGELIVEAEDCGNDDKPNRGYSGFFTVFGFNDDGSLAWIGAWE